MKFIRQLSPLHRVVTLLCFIALLAAGLYSGIMQQRLINPLLAPLDERAQSALQQSLVLSNR